MFPEKHLVAMRRFEFRKVSYWKLSRLQSLSKYPGNDFFGLFFLQLDFGSFLLFKKKLRVMSNFPRTASRKKLERNSSFQFRQRTVIEWVRIRAFSWSHYSFRTFLFSATLRFSFVRLKISVRRSKKKFRFKSRSLGVDILLNMSRVDEFDVNYPCSTLFGHKLSGISTSVHGYIMSNNV